jgi:futalosine hydrolase
MQILVAAATEHEIAAFIHNNPTADILITGVGTPETIYQLTRRIHLVDYDVVIQAGIAGSFITSLQPADVVMVKADVFADLGVKANGKYSTVFEAGLADPNTAPYTSGWLVNDGSFPVELNYVRVNAITVNTVTNDMDHISALSDKFNASIETMEGAALHYVCLLNDLHFLQLRSISNYVGERDKAKWKMSESIERLNHELQLIYDKLLKTSFSD